MQSERCLMFKKYLVKVTFVRFRWNSRGNELISYLDKVRKYSTSNLDRVLLKSHLILYRKIYYKVHNTIQMAWFLHITCHGSI